MPGASPLAGPPGLLEDLLLRAAGALPRLASGPTLAILLPGLALLVLLGDDAGLLLAAGLLPRLFRPRAVSKPSGARELLLTLVCGAAFLLACRRIAPGLFEGPPLIASDTAEHFWLLHSLESPRWLGWSFNRYPLPALLVHVFTSEPYPFEAWYAGAQGAVFCVGAGLYLWGRALVGAEAGLLGVILALAFPEIVLLVATPTAYPVIVAIWVIGSAFAALAWARPSAGRCLAAALASALVFASDVRGILPGIACSLLTLLACLRLSGLTARVLGVGALALALGGSWGIHYLLPIRLLTLEAMLETSLQVAHERAGLPLPRRMIQDGRGYAWGRSSPMRLLESYRHVRAVRRQFDDPSLRTPDLVFAREKRMKPLLTPALPLGALAPFVGAPPLAAGAPLQPWWRRWGLLQRLALLTCVPGLLLLLQVWRYEYAERYAALAWPSLVVLVACGIVALAGRGRPLILYLGLGAALLLWLPSPLRLDAGWRLPFGTPEELRACVVGTNDAGVANQPNVANCLAAQRRPLRHRIAWPWG
jgi:hypothetical protein